MSGGNKMHGKITSYDDENEIGIIRGEDGKNYTMSVVDCMSIIAPNVGGDVNFRPSEDKATEIYVISQQVHPTSMNPSKPDSPHHVSKKPAPTLLPIVIVLSLASFIAVLIYGEIDRRNIKEVQNLYDSQIKKIETLIATANCTEAQAEYMRSQETRNQIFKMGLYYSLDSHPIQAHAIEIAECYANKKAFPEAIGMLDINAVNDPDYLLRASLIYKNSGDIAKAAEAKSMADKYDTSK